MNTTTLKNKAHQTTITTTPINSSHNPEEWTNTFCSNICGGDCGTCIGAWCCPCLLYGRISSRYKAFPGDDYSTINTSCFTWLGLWGLGISFIPQMRRRRQIRDMLGIRGSVAKDCCVSCWCAPCSLAQMNVEMRERAEVARGGSGATGGGAGGYEKKVGGMVYEARDGERGA